MKLQADIKFTVKDVKDRKICKRKNLVPTFINVKLASRSGNIKLTFKL